MRHCEYIEKFVFCTFEFPRALTQQGTAVSRGTTLAVQVAVSAAVLTLTVNR